MNAVAAIDTIAAPVASVIADALDFFAVGSGVFAAVLLLATGSFVDVTEAGALVAVAGSFVVAAGVVAFADAVALLAAGVFVVTTGTGVVVVSCSRPDASAIATERTIAMVASFMMSS